MGANNYGVQDQGARARPALALVPALLALAAVNNVDGRAPQRVTPWRSIDAGPRGVGPK